MSVVTDRKITDGTASKAAFIDGAGAIAPWTNATPTTSIDGKDLVIVETSNVGQYESIPIVLPKGNYRVSFDGTFPETPFGVKFGVFYKENAATLVSEDIFAVSGAYSYDFEVTRDNDEVFVQFFIFQVTQGFEARVSDFKIDSLDDPSGDVVTYVPDVVSFSDYFHLVLTCRVDMGIVETIVMASKVRRKMMRSKGRGIV